MLPAGTENSLAGLRPRFESYRSFGYYGYVLSLCVCSQKGKGYPDTGQGVPTTQTIPSPAQVRVSLVIERNIDVLLTNFEVVFICKIIQRDLNLNCRMLSFSNF